MGPALWISIVLASGIAFTGSVGPHRHDFGGREAQRREAALQTWQARKADKSCVLSCRATDAKGCRRWVTLCRGDRGWPPK